MENKKILKNRAKVDLRIIEKFLQEWDPLNVIDDLIKDGLSPDEYNSYAPKVLSLLQKGCNSEDIANYLNNIESAFMGKASPNKAGSSLVAIKIKEWWNGKNV